MDQMQTPRWSSRRTQGSNWALRRVSWMLSSLRRRRSRCLDRSRCGFRRRRFDRRQIHEFHARIILRRWRVRVCWLREGRIRRRGRGRRQRGRLRWRGGRRHPAKLAGDPEQQRTPQFRRWRSYLHACRTIRPLGNDTNKREPVKIRRAGLMLRDRLREVSDLVFEITDPLAKRRIFAGPQRAPLAGRLAYGITGLRSCASQHGRSRVGDLGFRRHRLRSLDWRMKRDGSMTCRRTSQR